ADDAAESHHQIFDRGRVGDVGHEREIERAVADVEVAMRERFDDESTRSVGAGGLRAVAFDFVGVDTARAELEESLTEPRGAFRDDDDAAGVGEGFDVSAKKIEVRGILGTHGSKRDPGAYSLATPPGIETCD